MKRVILSKEWENDAISRQKAVEEMKKHPNTNLPIGKYHMSTFRYALKQYIQFRNEILF